MSVFTSADFLLPKEQYLSTWPVIACDQFTSEKSYWERLAEQVGNHPSALHLIYPEVYLSEKMDGRIQNINASMQQVLSSQIMQDYRDCFVYIERELMNGSIRRGLLGVIDLEAYSFQPDADTPVRATEKTVPERIPPRVRIRENAPLELSHVLMFCDDPMDTVLGPLEAAKEDLPVLYDLELMEHGGHLKGYLVSGTYASETQARIDSYEAVRASKMPASPVFYLVGDGNHSLATAKTCYDSLKREGAGQENTERARYAMVELGNIRDEAFAFEPIHRLITETNVAKLLQDIREICSEKGYPVRWTAGGKQGLLYLNQSLGQLPVGILQNWLDKYLQTEPGKIDYIHGEDSLRKLSEQENTLGLELPPIGKDAFFDAIERDGVLPRKTFSIGHAQEKRYYLEARRIC